jgi:hypothetical protein
MMPAQADLWALLVIADLAHLQLDRPIIHDPLLAQEVFQRAQEVRVVTVARLDPSVRVRLVGLANFNSQSAAGQLRMRAPPTEH